MPEARSVRVNFPLLLRNRWVFSAIIGRKHECWLPDIAHYIAMCRGLDLCKLAFPNNFQVFGGTSLNITRQLNGTYW
tara:strand:+ start:3258 stop:3488 length:231 start_codon:yes stop_codon:yes gene_type:complete